MRSPSSSRRGFLRGMRSSHASSALRPPWALAEEAFVSLCTRCDDCITACPNDIVVRGDGGFPTIDFSRGECSFCAECVRHCRTGALRRADEADPPWQLTAEIAGNCLAFVGVECRICGENCPLGVIRFRPRRGGVAVPELDAGACSGCGACFAPCPAQAIIFNAEQERLTENMG